MPRRQYELGLRIAIFILVGGIFTACSSDDPKTVQPTLSSLWEFHFGSCGTNCHNGSASNGTENGPDFSTPQSFRTGLLSKSSNDYPSWLKTTGCDGTLFIAPNDANNSLLAAAMIESISTPLQSGTCDTAYNVHLSNNLTITAAATQQALIDWINNGAQNN